MTNEGCTNKLVMPTISSVKDTLAFSATHV